MQLQIPPHVHCESLSVWKYYMANQFMLACFGGKKRAHSSNVWDHFGFKSHSKARCWREYLTFNKLLQQPSYGGGNSWSALNKSGFGLTKKCARASSHHLMLQQRVAEYLIVDFRPSCASSLIQMFDLPGKRVLLVLLFQKCIKKPKKNYRLYERPLLV